MRPQGTKVHLGIHCRSVVDLLSWLHRPTRDAEARCLTHTPTSYGYACYQSQNCGHKHTGTGHPLPDFSLQNTCKLASITTSATRGHSAWCQSPRTASPSGAALSALAFDTLIVS